MEIFEPDYSSYLIQRCEEVGRVYVSSQSHRGLPEPVVVYLGAHESR